MKTTNDSTGMKLVRRRDIENFLIDAFGHEPSDYEDYTVRELVEMLQENGYWMDFIGYNS